MTVRNLDVIGVVGLGLMGASIIVSFLNAGYKVVALTPLPEELKIGTQRIQDQIQICHKMGFLKYNLSDIHERLSITDNYANLEKCELVVECVIEIETIKAQVYSKIERVVSERAIIASNTSAIPISKLQKYLTKSSRFMGIHWAEPAFATRFLEITCGEDTNRGLSEMVKTEAENWDKEPTLLYKDIRGFITNRLMYAVYREAFHLLNSNVANKSAIDKCFQYDVGAWIPLMGIFKRMDFIGLSQYIQMFEEVFPRLTTTTDVPPQMLEIAKRKGRGIHNLDGIYEYTVESAKELEDSLALFNEEIFHLIETYTNKKINKSIK